MKSQGIEVTFENSMMFLPSSVQIEQDTKLKGKYVEMLLKPKDGLFVEGHIDFGDVNSGSVAAKKIVLR